MGGRIGGEGGRVQEGGQVRGWESVGGRQEGGQVRG